MAMEQRQMGVRGKRFNGAAGHPSRRAAVKQAVAMTLEPMEGRTLFSLAPVFPLTEQAVNFVPGPTVADPARDVVYMVDQTDKRLLAINTDTGGTVAYANLAGYASGIAVAVTDDKIYEFFAVAIEPETQTLLSEDYYFCKHARNHGIKVWGAPWVNFAHVGTYAFEGRLTPVPA